MVIVTLRFVFVAESHWKNLHDLVRNKLWIQISKAKNKVRPVKDNTFKKFGLLRRNKLDF